MSDILRRLKATGAIRETRVGNRRCFSLNLTADERRCLSDFFSVFENATIQKRANRFDRIAAQRLEWMDDTFKFYRDVKMLKHDPS